MTVARGANSTDLRSMRSVETARKSGGEGEMVMKVTLRPTRSNREVY